MSKSGSEGGQNTQENPSEQKPKVTITSKDILTPRGTRSDVQKEIKNLLDEIKTTRAEVDEKIGDKLRKENIIRRKALEGSTEPQRKKDLPVDGDYVEGSRIFMINCSGCHSLESSNQGRKSVDGPALGLIYGRKVASQKFYEYTESMLSSEKVWNERFFHHFLKNPKKVFPETRCNIKGGGLKSEEDRADLVIFLKLFTKNLNVNLNLKARKFFGDEYVDTQEYTQSELNKKIYEDFRDAAKGGR